VGAVISAMQRDLIPVGVCDDGCPAPFTVLGFHYNGDIGFAQFFNRSFDIFNGQPDDRPRSFVSLRASVVGGALNSTHWSSIFAVTASPRMS